MTSRPPADTTAALTRPENELTPAPEETMPPSTVSMPWSVAEISVPPAPTVSLPWASMVVKLATPGV